MSSHVADGKKKKNIKPSRSQKQAMALHETDGTTHVVGIGNIKVIICQDGDAWFAQGLEVDYAASGHSLEEVKKNFEAGLEGTIDLHIKAYGSIKNLLKVAPQDAWVELHLADDWKRFKYTQVTFHDDLSKTLGYQGINFIEPTRDLVA